MKKLISFLTALLLIFTVSCGQVENQGNEKGPENNSQHVYKIGIIQLVEHLSLDQIRDSINSRLAELGYEDGKNCIIDYKNAAGDINNLAAIVSQFEGDKKDIIIAIATPTAQAASKLSKDTPIVFAAVTDPVEAGIVKSLDDTSGNITGTSDAVNVDAILSLALEFIPQAKTFGVLYNSSEANSVANIAKAQKFADENGLTLKEQTVTKTSEVKQAAETLAGSVDFIFSPNDNTVATAMAALTQVQNETKVPVFVGADSMVYDGGLATRGIDYSLLGKETANIADEILKGKTVSTIPVKVFEDDLNTYVNESAAEKIGMTIPEKVKSDSKYVGIK